MAAAKEVVFTERNMYACGHTGPAHPDQEDSTTSNGRCKKRTRVRFFRVASPCNACLGNSTEAPAVMKQLKTELKKVQADSEAETEKVKTESVPAGRQPVLDEARKKRYDEAMEKVQLAKQKLQLIREMISELDKTQPDGSAEEWSEAIPSTQELMRMATKVKA